MGDSMLQGSGERRLGRNENIVKVRCFPGAQLDDMYSYIANLSLLNNHYNLTCWHESLERFYIKENTGENSQSEGLY